MSEENMDNRGDEPFEYGSYPQNEPAPTPEYQEPYQYNESANRPSGGDGKAVAALVLGIISIVLCWVPIVSWICAIIALVMSITYKKSGGQEKRSLATGGMICAIIGLVISVIVFIVTFVITMNAIMPMLTNGF